MANKSTTIQIRVDADLKRQAAKVLEAMHMTMSQAVTMFLVQVVQQGRIPLDYLQSNPQTPKTEQTEDYSGVDQLTKYLAR